MQENDNYDWHEDWRIKRFSVPQEIAKFLVDSFFITEIRRRVGKADGISFEVRSRERNHSVPHVHASYGGYSVSISIEDGIVRGGNLPKKREKISSEWVLAHKEELLTVWKNYSMSATSMLTQSLLNSSFDEE